MLRFWEHHAVRNVAPVVTALAITGGAMAAIAGIHGLGNQPATTGHPSVPSLSASSAIPGPVPPAAVKRTTAARSAPPAAILSPVLAVRVHTSTPAPAGGTSGHGTSGGALGAVIAGGAPSPQSSPPVVTSPAPHPSTSSPAQTCITVAGAPVCARVRVQAGVALGG